MINETMLKDFQEICAALPRAKREMLAKKINELQQTISFEAGKTLVTTSRKPAWTLVRFLLKLTWRSTGATLLVNSYEKAGNEVNRSPSTVCMQLFRGRGTASFVSPDNADVITIEKIPVEKKQPPTPVEKFMLEVEPNCGQSGVYGTLDEVAKVIKMPAQALKHRVTRGKGAASFVNNDELISVKRIATA